LHPQERRAPHRCVKAEGSDGRQTDTETAVFS